MLIRIRCRDKPRVRKKIIECKWLSRSSARNPKACYTDRKPETRMLYDTRVSAALNVCFRPKTVIRGVDLRSIEGTAVIELLLTRPERKVGR